MSWREWRDVFLTKGGPFHQRLLDAAETTVAMTEVLVRFVSTTDAAEQALLAARARDTEHAGDLIRQDILDKLHQTFVTPFDREDINDLSRAIDDIADYAESTIKEIQLYQIRPDTFIRNMAEILHDAVVALQNAIQALARNREESLALAHEAKAKENRIEELYRRSIVELGNESDIHYLIKLREVYRHLSNAADRVDMAANVITAIVVKEGA
jgi:predicted phosphate transport protein (TIGR00153 family)